MILYFKRLRPESVIPSFGHDDSSNAGLDLFIAEEREVGPYQDAWISTGIAWEPLLGLADAIWKPALLIRSRSSSLKRGLFVAEGTVDSGYRGEIMLYVLNRTPQAITLSAGERIAQAVPILIPQVQVQEVEALGDSARGERGFGSSGM